MFRREGKGHGPGNPTAGVMQSDRKGLRRGLVCQEPRSRTGMERATLMRVHTYVRGTFRRSRRHRSRHGRISTGEGLR
jgi:hypothetical protein